MLRERHGLTMRRACGVLEDGFGLDLSPGGLAQMIQRCASRLEAEEQRLLEAARSADVQHADETSWWVAHPEMLSVEEGSEKGTLGEGTLGEKSSESPKWWLWTFTNGEQTIYRVEPSRERDVVHEVLGSDFEGVLVSDCLNIYDGATPTQQKCYAHHLKAISKAEGDYEAKAGESSAYLRRLRGLLTGAIALKEAKLDLSARRVQSHREALEDSADRLLKPGRADSLTEIEDSGPASAEKAAGPPLHVSGSRESAGHKQPGRAESSPGSGPAETQLWQSHIARCGGIRADGECAGDVCQTRTFSPGLPHGNDVAGHGAAPPSLNRYRWRPRRFAYGGCVSATEHRASGGGRDAVSRIQAFYRTTVIFWVFVVPPACRRRK